MTEPAPEKSPPLRLHAFGGREAPAGLVADVLRLAALPPAARQRFWEVLGPSLAEPLPRELDALVDKFIQAHQVDSGDLLRAVKACRALLRSAAGLDVGAKPLADDLEKLSGGAPEIRDALLPGYERAKSAVRSELARRSLADHGKLLEGIHWRIETEWSSDRARGFRLPVVMLTLRYREGNRRDQITVQVLPDLLGQLRSLCDQILPRR